MKSKKTNGLRERHSFNFNRLSLHNFRGFKNLPEIELAPVTFIVGQNSSGKSSLIDALLFLSQSNVLPSYEFELSPTWIGRLVDLGSFRDTVYRHNIQHPITINVGFAIDYSFRLWRNKNHQPDKIDINFGVTFVSKKTDSIGRLKKITLSDPKTTANLSLTFSTGRNIGAKLKIADSTESWQEPIKNTENITNWIDKRFYKLLRLASADSKRGAASGYRLIRKVLNNSFFIGYFLSSVQRVKSGRDAPRRWYPASNPVRVVRGIRVYDAVGGITPSDIEASMDEPSQDQSLSKQGRHSKRSHGKLDRRISRALLKMNIARKISSKTLSPYHKSVHISDNKSGVDANIIDVGFGASQVLPVLFEASKDEAAPLFVEQPEIHLHPRAQGEVAEYLLDTAQYRQVFIETHSVHLINRARIRILKGELLPSDVTILYVEKNNEGSKVISIGIDENGEFTTEWPNGFFDERYEDTLNILALKKGK